MKVTINGPRYYKEDLKPGAFDLCVQSICCYNNDVGVESPCVP